MAGAGTIGGTGTAASPDTTLSSRHRQILAPRIRQAVDVRPVRLPVSRSPLFTSIVKVFTCLRGCEVIHR